MGLIYHPQLVGKCDLDEASNYNIWEILVSFEGKNNTFDGELQTLQTSGSKLQIKNSVH